MCLAMLYKCAWNVLVLQSCIKSLWSYKSPQANVLSQEACGCLDWESEDLGLSLALPLFSRCYNIWLDDTFTSKPHLGNL